MPRSGSWAVGVDIGATNMQAAVIRRADGAVGARVGQPTPGEEGPEVGLPAVLAMVAQALAQAGLDASDLAGIGVGCTGPLDLERGLIMAPWTMPRWDEVPIVRALADRFGVPVWLDNDCNVAALGEHWVGAGRGARHMVYVTVSTGIGAGVILDGRLRRGVGGNLGEVGLMTIDFDGAPCLDGSSGCWEHLAAGPAIARAAATDPALLDRAGGDPLALTAELVARWAGEGDRAARAVMEREAFYLGVGVANLLAIFAPEVIVLGGGVIKSWDLLWPTLERTARQRTRMLPTAQRTPIVRAELGLAAGFTGAARLAFLSEE